MQYELKYGTMYDTYEKVYKIHTEKIDTKNKIGQGVKQSMKNMCNKHIIEEMYQSLEQSVCSWYNWGHNVTTYHYKNVTTYH